MIRRYIAIDSVDDIDTSRISVANINDRYIDKKGNRFATRFNMRTKKIQIVRIALGEEEARRARGVIVQGLVRRKIHDQSRKKEHEHGEDQSSISSSGEDLSPPDLFEMGTINEQPPLAASHGPATRKPIPEWIEKAGIRPAEKVNPGELIVLLDENYKLLAERLFGVINNVKNSTIMQNIAEIDDAIDFTNIYDHKIEPKMNETKKYVGEFEKYAERPEHYMTMIEKDFRIYLHDLSEPEVMEFLKAYFIGQCALQVLEETMFFITAVMEKAKTGDQSNLTPDKKQFLEYARSTCEFLTGYIKEEGSKILAWLIEQKIF